MKNTLSLACNYPNSPSSLTTYFLGWVWSFGLLNYSDLSGFCPDVRLYTYIDKQKHEHMTCPLPTQVKIVLA